MDRNANRETGVAIHIGKAIAVAKSTSAKTFASFIILISLLGVGRQLVGKELAICPTADHNCSSEI